MVERGVTVAQQGLAKTGLRHPIRDAGTKSLMASVRWGAVGVIYPILLGLMRFNSHPINADRYLIGW
jgi:hypothetical protein